MSPRRQSTSRQIDDFESVLIAQASSWIGFLNFWKRKEEKCFSKTSASIHTKTRCQNPETFNINNACREKWKTYKTALAETRIWALLITNLKKRLTKLITILFPKVFGLSSWDSEVTFRPRIHSGIFVTLVCARCQIITGFFI